jgi:hypothetical protein
MSHITENVNEKLVEQKITWNAQLKKLPKKKTILGSSLLQLNCLGIFYTQYPSG